MGKKKKSESESKERKHMKTDVSRGENAVQDLTSPPDMEKHPPTLPRLATLRAILEDVSAPPQLWPKEALRAILKRYERVPRKGWDMMYTTYVEKFGNNISSNEFKRSAEMAIVSQSGQKCSRTKYVEESTKRSKNIVDLLEEKSMSEFKLYTRVRDQLLVELGKLGALKVEDVPVTKKISSEQQDTILIELINQAIAEILPGREIKNWTDLVRILQAAQLTYHAISAKPKIKSEWKNNIQKKCSVVEESIRLLKIPREQRTAEEVSKSRKVMRELGLALDRRDDLVEAISVLTEKSAVYQRKLSTHEKRKEFSRKNRSFELYRSRFYQNLSGKSPEMPAQVSEEDVRRFWSTMWIKTETNQDDFSEYLTEYIPESENSMMEYFPTELEFEEIVKWLPSWKAPGPDGIYNFFIRKCTSLHTKIYEMIKKTCMSGEKVENWFYMGISHLIPKGIPKKGSDYRPITCMSNLYKLTTKCVTQVMQQVVEHRGLLSENQLGTVRMVQGAKEQSMINIAINKAAGNKLKTAWIDVKKAFDSVQHSYLLECIEKLNFPSWIIKFLKSIMEQWNINIKLNNSTILEKRIERGILQGDSLSPLLFVLCMNPLSRKLNMSFPKVAVPVPEGDHYVSNHLLFIDDLKLFAEGEDVLEKMMRETERFFEVVGLEMNKAKSATNCDVLEDKAVVMGVTEGYKYLGITENRNSQVTRETVERVHGEILCRVEQICKSGLNGRNTITAINEYALSLINYYIGAVPMEHSDYEKIDNDVRKLLVKYKIHLQPANTERLYLPRKELGRGLGNVVHKSEKMELQLFAMLDRYKDISLRRAAILKVMKDEKAPTALIVAYLKARYNIEEEINLNVLEAAQKRHLYSEIKEKTRHEKLYRSVSNEAVDVQNSSLWLTHGNITAQDEAYLCYLQDRNMFGGDPGICQHCKERTKSVDHLASQCNKMLGYDYTRRHNEVVKCIHLLLCNKYGIKRSKRLRNHSVQEISANSDVEIRVDTTVITSTKQSANRPDLVIHDKKRKEITIIEIGITSQDQLQIVENEKAKKYDLLAKEMGATHKCKTKIIPYVMTWDGIVTRFHKKYSKEIGLTTKIEAYIQYIVLKKTLESISFEYRRGGPDGTQDGLESLTRVRKVEDEAPAVKAIVEVSTAN